VKVDWIDLHLTLAAGVVLRHWLEEVPIEMIPVTERADRQALADLFAQLEWSVPEATGEELDAARQALLKDAGPWIEEGALYKSNSPDKGGSGA